jgi:hypothetical protein
VNQHIILKTSWLTREIARSVNSRLADKDRGGFGSAQLPAVDREIDETYVVRVLRDSLPFCLAREDDPAMPILANE